VLFSSHFGLLGGFISSLCLAVSMTMALGAYLPEPSQAPLGRVYLAIGTITGALLGHLGSGRRQILRAAPASRSYAIRLCLLRRRFPAVLSATTSRSFRGQLFVQKLRTKETPKSSKNKNVKSATPAASSLCGNDEVHAKIALLVTNPTNDTKLPG
jgi:hypothetical protein